MDTLPVYILAGGKSSRYGCDKARVLLGGVPLIRRVADALDPVAVSVTVVAASVGAYQDIGLTTIGDTHPGLGPLGGLDTAMSDRVARHGEGWLLLASCDLAEPNADWARLLIGRARQGAGVVAFKGERWEPLFALYHSSQRPTVRKQLDSGQLALWRLIERARPVELGLPDGVTRIEQINTRADHDRFEGGCG
jgi:molybdenum cofactor guanylyltransferase